jgi:restriction endonuclease Mrr
MGYGGSRQDAGRAVGRSGDGGIDGIIKEDKLGLDVIYVQAKRWEGTASGNTEVRWCSSRTACEQGGVHHHVRILARGP